MNPISGSRRARLAGLALFVAIQSAAQVQGADDSDAQRQVASLEAELVQAVLKADGQWLDRHLASDYTVIRGDGRLGRRNEELRNLTSGVTKFDAYDLRGLEVRIYGETAVCTMVLSTKGRVNGKPFAGDARATRVWVKQDGVWKLANHQATRIAGN